MSGISGLGSYTNIMQQAGAMQRRPDPAQKFNKLDTDANGGIDQTEMTVLIDKVAEKTGESMDVEEAFSAADANSDGLLDQDEMGSIMAQMHEKMGGPPGGGKPPKQALAAYGESMGNDSVTSLLEMLNSNAEDSEERYTPLSFKL